LGREGAGSAALLLVAAAETELVAGGIHAGVDMAVDAVRRALLDLLAGAVQHLLRLLGVLGGEILGLVQRVIETHDGCPLVRGTAPCPGRRRQRMTRPSRVSNVTWISPPIGRVLPGTPPVHDGLRNTDCVSVRNSVPDEKRAAPLGPRTPPRGRSARWDHVLTLLASTKRLSVADVAQDLDVSESTVRRDFVEMERAQLARRTHGGIVAVDVAYSLATVPRSSDEGSAQRERVADRAAEMV